MFKISTMAAALAMTMVGSAQAQAPPPKAKPASPAHPMPTFRKSVVSRTTRAVSYKHRSGSTKIDFQGTDLMPGAAGEARVESKRGALEIQGEFSGLGAPASFGTEYLTYVLWAISPEGRPVNLGEVLLGDDHKSKLEVTTNLQAFALIVTAEPYYAVRRPSNLVVLENAVRSDTVGATEAVEAKYELIDRGGYVPTGYTFDPLVLSGTLPLEFFEARNALRIAESAGAERYATASYAKAVRDMKAVDAQATGKHEDKKALISSAREVVQTAEDAREIAVKHIDAMRAEADRQAGTQREAAATARASAESKRRIDAEATSADAVRLANEAKRRSVDAEAATADAVRQRKEADQRSADAVAAAASAQQKQHVAEADADLNRAAAASADAQLQLAVRDREGLRSRLLKQFNLILDTRDTARGLVVNMSDVLFDTGQYTLRPLAREKLAKISGIVLAYPSLKLAIEGNTDSVGGEAYNQDLSERRAQGVRAFLTEQGVPEASSTAIGFGKTKPVASNDTSEGRQQNRRVELVVSGDVIGTNITSLNVQPVGPPSVR